MVSLKLESLGDSALAVGGVLGAGISNERLRKGSIRHSQEDRVEHPSERDHDDERKESGLRKDAGDREQ